MQGRDGTPYRDGGAWIRRIPPHRYEPKMIDRRPDPVHELSQNAHRQAGIRAILFMLKLKKVPPRRVLSAAFYPRRANGTKKD